MEDNFSEFNSPSILSYKPKKDTETFLVKYLSEIQDTIPETSWLVKDLISTGGCGIVVGPPKGLKTWLLIDLLVSIATGTQFLGKFEVINKGKVLFFCAEQNEESIKKRVLSVAITRGLTESDLSNFLIIAENNMDLSDRGDFSKLIATIDEHQPVLVALDPLRRVMSIDENSSKQVGEILSKIRNVQRELNVSFVLAHHTGKKSQSETILGGQFRGSSDFHSFGDFNFYMQPTKADQKIIKISFESRDFAPADSVHFSLVEKNDGIGLSCVDEPIVAQNYDAKFDFSRNAIKLLKDNPLSGNKINEELGGNRNSNNEVIKDLVAQGLLKREGNKYHLVNAIDEAAKSEH